ncbi:NosD domain-containing protein [Propionibacteriaceae bacterium Y2011]
MCTSDGVIGINGISLNYAKDVTVTGNVCQGMPYHGINISYPDRAVVTGNVSFENKKGLAIDSTDHGMSYGNVVVGNNMIYDNETDYHIPQYPWSGNIALAEPLDIMQILANKVGFYGMEPTEQPTGYAEIEPVGDGIDFDPSTAGAREISDTLATLIRDLKRLGLIG